MPMTDGSIPKETVLESAAQHFSARDLGADELERLCDHLAVRAHTPEALAERSELELGDVEAFLEWAVDGDLVVHDTLVNDDRLFALSHELIDQARRRLEPAESLFDRRLRRHHRRINIGYAVLAPLGVAGGIAGVALGYEGAGMVGVAFICPGALLWPLALLASYVYLSIVHPT